MSYEAEMPGMKITKEHLEIICNRYYFAAVSVLEKDVLEVGCGPGLGLGYLSHRAKRVIGGDYAEDNLRCAQQHYQGRVGLVLMEAHNLPFKNNSFDVVAAMAVVAYLDLDRFFGECYRVLRKEGTLVFCAANKDQPNFPRSPLSRNCFSVPELRALLGQHFEAEFYGAFPVHKALPVMKRRDTLVARVGKTLALMPKGEEIKESLSRLVFGTTVLREEIEDEMAEHIQPEPILDGSPTSDYRILYAIAHRR